jgi:hypothetical protein
MRIERCATLMCVKAAMVGGLHHHYERAAA